MKMPFGKFKNSDLGEIPNNYFEYLLFEGKFLKEPLKTAVQQEYASRSDKQVCKATVASDDMDLKKETSSDLAQQFHSEESGAYDDILKAIDVFREAILQKMKNQ
ncbi:MAG: DUF3820 family protein [Thermodesulfobacteriota bacterium]|jgi:hypothetical protein